MLFVQHANAKWVALDPIPKFDEEVLVGIVSLRRENFAGLLKLGAIAYQAESTCMRDLLIATVYPVTSAQ